MLVQTGNGSSQLVSSSSDVLTGSTRATVGIVSNTDFDEVKISIENTGGADAGTTKVYGVLVQKGCAGPKPVCRGIVYPNTNVYPMVIEGSRTGINTAVCAGCSIDNPEFVIDAPTNNFGRINLISAGSTSGSISARDLITGYLQSSGR